MQIKNIMSHFLRNDFRVSLFLALVLASLYQLSKSSISESSWQFTNPMILAVLYTLCLGLIQKDSKRVLGKHLRKMIKIGLLYFSLYVPICILTSLRWGVGVEDSFTLIGEALPRILASTVIALLIFMVTFAPALVISYLFKDLNSAKVRP